VGWNDANGEGKTGRDDYFSLSPNTTKLIHILLKAGEEPISYWTHYIPLSNGKGRSVICPGRDTCPACASGKYKTSRKHSFNIYDHDSKTVKILEMGNTVIQQLGLIGDQFECKAKGWSDIDISIRRIGQGLETQYVVIPVPVKNKLDTTSLKLHNIENIKTPHSEQEISNIISGKASSEHSRAPIQKPTEEVVTPADINFPWDGKEGEEEQQQTSTNKSLPFGKYQGKTLEEVYTIDPSYVKWCSENIGDVSIKQEARRIISGEQDKQPVRAGDEKLILINKIQEILNLDKRYQGKFDVIIGKMKEATQSPTFPNGKTLLTDYSMDELNKLLLLVQ